jgi:hypothetical protein
MMKYYASNSKHFFSKVSVHERSDKNELGSKLLGTMKEQCAEAETHVLITSWKSVEL